jgi:hypothetical protein
MNPDQISFRRKLHVPIAMLAGRRVQACILEPESLDWPPVKNVGLDNFVNIRQLDSSVPNGLRINNNIGAVLALVEAPGLVGANSSLQAQFCQFVLEALLEFRFACWITTASRMPRRAHVSAHENMSFKFRHELMLQEELRMGWGGS